MARIFKSKYPKTRTLVGLDGRPVLETRIASRGPNKGRPVTTPKRLLVLDKNGKPVYIESRKWAIDYSDATGRRRTVGGYTDKTATLQKAAAIEKAVARQKEGITGVDVQHAETAVAKHIAAWLSDLERAGRSPEYTRKVKARIERLQRELHWTRPSTIRADSFTEWLTAEARKGASDRTVNHFIEAATAFCNWTVAQKRLETNPLKHVSKTHSVEPKNKRRALTVVELQRLVVVHQARGMVYLAAALTGLRRGELGSLQWGDVHLEDERPHILLRAATTKSRRADTIALNVEIASHLEAIRPAGWKPEDRVFPSIPKSSTFAADLAASAIDRDKDGKRADFHSLRVTHATLLATSGVSVREAMEQMRHTDIRLTTKVYTDPRLFDLNRAVNTLPRIVPPTQEHQRARATGTDDTFPNIRSDIRKELAAPGRKGSKTPLLCHERDTTQSAGNGLKNAISCTSNKWRRGESKSTTKTGENRVFQSRNADLPRITRNLHLTTRDPSRLIETVRHRFLRVPIVYSFLPPAATC